MRRLRCLLGFHKWVFRDEVDEFVVDGVVWVSCTTLSRCSNPECLAHEWWLVVGVEYRAQKNTCMGSDLI